MELRFSIFEDFLALVFPKTCCLCKRSLFDFENQLCKICIANLPIADYHLRPQNNDLVVKIMGLTHPNLVMSFLRFTKKGISQSLLHQLKYKNRPEIGAELGRIYGSILHSVNLQNNWDEITPVPLHPLKQKRRGYNQSEQFANGLSESLGIPVNISLERVQFTETQTSKSRIERIENVSEVFKVKKESQLAGKRILLVDDVMTTGATLVSCANILHRQMVKTVDLAVIAAGKA
ncbi:comF family protein [Aquiflexum balticum DSM 16537]|uniref:ComF family protein n=1 Tax=Aquiflexum balticum DSM 16537 TaxID=758820 RepID=A0A1W2H1K7_9BACT|nr:phosphoribosyltransferase family protein [Aquiflexum balticum]SMD42502.1 comF family protein [Aquiflexum balticum DSM 16537]